MRATPHPWTPRRRHHHRGLGPDPARGLLRRLRGRLARSRAEAEKGAVLVLTVLSLVPICLFAGLAVDLGNVAQTHLSVRDATDSAALLGAADLGSSSYTSGSMTQGTIVTNVEDELIQDMGSATSLTAGSSAWDTCTAPLPAGWPTWPNDSSGHAQDCIAFDASNTSADVLQVALPPTVVHSVFGQVGGVSGQTVSTVSTAEVANGGGAAPCGVCILNASGTTLTSNGTATLTVTSPAGSGGNSNIVVDSSSSSDALVNGTGEIKAVNGEIETVGTTLGNGCSPCFSPTPQRISSALPDPLASLPVLSWSSLSVGSQKGAPVCNACGSMTITPGIYSSITLNGSGTLTLDPGLYVITGSFTSNGTGSVVGNGVLLYFVCGSGTSPASCPSSGQSGGSLTLNGTGTLTLNPITSSNCSTMSPNTCSYSPDFGLTVFYDRDNTASMTLNGSPTSNFTGTVYAAKAQMTLNGNGGTMNSLIDVGSMVLNGNATVSVSYNPGQNASSGPTDQPELCSISAATC